jgi:isopenicillin-N epimerase
MVASEDSRVGQVVGEDFMDPAKRWDWDAVRDSVEMDPELTYLNTGTSGLVPKTVDARVMELRIQLHRNPTDAVWRSLWDDLWMSRTRLAAHLGTSPDRLIFFTNISHAINTFCLSVPLPEGAEILMTNHEYGSMQHAWQRAAKRHGWRIRIVALPVQESDPTAYVDAIDSGIGQDTKLLYLSHVLYTTGHVLPMQEIINKARMRGVLVFVDGAHVPGMLPLNLSRLRPHFYAANLHKWFLAPVGAAFLFVESGMEDHLEPWQVSWAYHDDRSNPHTRNEFGSTPWIRQFEMEGTRDLTPWRVIAMCCDFQEAIPEKARQIRFHELSQAVRESLQGMGGMQCVTPGTLELRGGLTSFLIPDGLDGHWLRRQLWERHRIEINIVNQTKGHDYFRVSTHIYNNQEEVERLAAAVRAEMKLP